MSQRFDIRAEATGDVVSGPAPVGLRLRIDGREDLPCERQEASDTGAPLHSTNVTFRNCAFETAGTRILTATTADGASATVRLHVQDWRSGTRQVPRARNIIVLVGDGMGAAHRTAARIVSRGVTAGRANDLLAMDRLPVTGLVMTHSLNAIVTDSAPGMAAYVTGHKSNNNQEGVYPDNTPAPFDNPRVEYLGELLRRTRGPGFGVGIVTTADVCDATPAANAIHTAARSASLEIAARYFDERATNAVRVLMGGGRSNFLPVSQGGARTDERDLVSEYSRDGYAVMRSAADLERVAQGPPPRALLGLFHAGTMSVAFDKLGAGRYSDELVAGAPEWRDQPMLDAMAAAALRVLSTHSPDGFYLMVEGASIDKQAHNVDAERTVWDTIEFDRAVGIALAFAERTNGDADPTNDTLVIVTADHESGGLAVVGVGNERYAPHVLGRAVRDYAAVFRFSPEQQLPLTTNYRVGPDGYPVDPDPSRKLLLGWAAAPDRFENWVSNRRAVPPTVEVPKDPPGTGRRAAENPARDGVGPDSDNATVDGRPIPGFLVPGVIENGTESCPPPACPADTSSVGHTIAGHTASDVPLSAFGPGMWQFTGTYDNTEVFLKILRASTGSHGIEPAVTPTR